MKISCRWEQNNNDTYHSKIFDLFNNKSNIIFSWQPTFCFAELYYDPEDIFWWFFDDKNGAYYLWIKVSE